MYGISFVFNQLGSEELMENGQASFSTYSAQAKQELQIID
jgi:hypothetical protein